MADFFDELGKKITETAEDLGRKAENAVEIQKIKGQIRSLKRANDRDLLDIGRMAYEEFSKSYDDIRENLKELCENDDFLASMICKDIVKRQNYW